MQIILVFHLNSTRLKPLLLLFLYFMNFNDNDILIKYYMGMISESEVVYDLT